MPDPHHLILIVDDDEGNRYTLQRILERAGYRTAVSGLGEEALKMAGREAPDLAILDVGLPDISGYELGQRIKKLSKSLIVPVLHISASFVGTEATVRGLDAGADGYLTHPVEPVIVLSTVRSFLRIREAEKERARNLQELQAKQAELEAARRTAEEANLAKSRFLANMSHEIRTPLAAILGFADLLKDAKVSASDRKEFIEIIRRSGRQLSNVIDDILDLSKVEAGKLEIERVPVSIPTVVADIKAFFVNQLVEKKINFAVTVGADVPESIVSDPTRFRQILINIIGNAVKFTKKGGVSVRFRMSRPNMMEIEVEDTGLGIEPAQQQRLFEPFTQADASMTRRFGGTGLGLGLSKRLARALGGDLVLTKSEVGKGSVFTIRVSVVEPNQRRATPTAGRRFPPNISGKRALLVEDVEENRILVKKMLAKFGVEVELAEDGQAGIAKALASDFDIVLMDLQMPGTDGTSATRELRERGYRGPIVALTAHALSSDRERCLSAGFDDHISKPINVSHLVEVVEEHTKH